MLILLKANKDFKQINMPSVSVILPVYNGEKYLPQAIESILSQSFSDFEFIIINDASTDGTEGIIRRFQEIDKRIVYYKNEQNCKVVGSLNKGIELSKGQFIARMDADDVALKDRFQQQVDFLMKHPDTSLVDVLMEYTDDDGKSLQKYNSKIFDPGKIKRYLANKNPLGHSSIMIRADILKKYKYNQTDFEDYELWLRLTGDGYKLAKLESPMLLYRIHELSITSKSINDKSHFLKQSRAKKLYLSNEVIKRHRWSWFDTRVFFFMMRDYFLYIYKNLKN